MSKQTIESSTSSEFLEEYIFFGHDTVTRFSFLRDDSNFINNAIKHPSTKIVIFNNDAPYGSIIPSIMLYYASYSELKSYIDEWTIYNTTNDIRLNDLRIIFLGLNERDSGITYKSYKGQAYFALDISTNKLLITHFESKFQRIINRDDVFKLTSFDSGIFSYSKTYLNWLKNNRFCSGCGSKTIPIHAGTKLQCSSINEEKCPVKSTNVSNISFPRIDPVVISVVTNKDYSKVLLGHGKKYLKKMYSTIAGFIEPSETIEIASLREIWEETGVKGYKCNIIKTQPWPYPANLMIGCCVFVEFNGINEKIHLGHDPELIDAKWINIEELKDLVYHRGKQYDYSIPPKIAIAHHLLEYVCKKHDELNNL